MSHDGDAWWLFDWEVRGAPSEHSWQGEAALAFSHCLYPASGGTCTAWWGPPSAWSRFTPRAAGKLIFRASFSSLATVLQCAFCPEADMIESSMLTGCHTVGRTVHFFNWRWAGQLHWQHLLFWFLLQHPKMSQQCKIIVHHKLIFTTLCIVYSLTTFTCGCIITIPSGNSAIWRFSTGRVTFLLAG